MAKAKTKQSAVIPFEQRAKSFESDLIELIKKHQVGVRPELASDRTKIIAVLNYLDLVEANAEESKK